MPFEQEVIDLLAEEGIVIADDDKDDVMEALSELKAANSGVDGFSVGATAAAILAAYGEAGQFNVDPPSVADVIENIPSATFATPQTGGAPPTQQTAAPPATGDQNPFPNVSADQLAQLLTAGGQPPKFSNQTTLPGLSADSAGVYWNERTVPRTRATQAQITAAFAERDRLNNIAAQTKMKHESGTGRAYWIDIDGKRNYYYNEDGTPATQYDKPEDITDNSDLLEEQRLSREAQTAHWKRNWDLQVAETNAALFNNAEKLRWENDKFAVQTAMGRDRLALETEVSIENALAEQRALKFQYGQLQQDARQFNATNKIAVDMENARRKELQQARRSQLASQIGQLAQDAGSRGELASMLLANPNLGLLSESLAGGQDFFTEESLAPLSDLLRQREDASRDPNLAKFRAINEIYPPEFDEPDIAPIRDAYAQIVAPTQQTDLAGAKNDPEPVRGTDAWKAWWWRKHRATVNPETGLTYGEEIDAANAERGAGTPPAGDTSQDPIDQFLLEEQQMEEDLNSLLLPQLGSGPGAAPAPASFSGSKGFKLPSSMPGSLPGAEDPYATLIEPSSGAKGFKLPSSMVGSPPGAEDPYATLIEPSSGTSTPKKKSNNAPLDLPVFAGYADGGLAQSAYIGDEKGPELHIPLGPGEALVIPHDKVESFLKSASRAGALGNANAIPKMAGGGKVKSQRQINFLLSKNSPLTVKQRARLKKELKTGDVKIPRMEKGGKFPEDSVAGDLVGMGISSMADGGMFDQGTIFGTAKPADQTQTRNFLQQALRRALTGTPWQGRGRAPTPVEVSAPGTDPMVRELAASLSALGTGTPQDVFLRRAAALSPRGIAERAGGVRRTA